MCRCWRGVAAGTTVVTIVAAIITQTEEVTSLSRAAPVWPGAPWQLGSSPPGDAAAITPAHWTDDKAKPGVGGCYQGDLAKQWRGARGAGTQAAWLRPVPGPPGTCGPDTRGVGTQSSAQPDTCPRARTLRPLCGKR